MSARAACARRCVQDETSGTGRLRRGPGRREQRTRRKKAGRFPSRPFSPHALPLHCRRHRQCRGIGGVPSCATRASASLYVLCSTDCYASLLRMSARITSSRMSKTPISIDADQLRKVRCRPPAASRASPCHHCLAAEKARSLAPGASQLPASRGAVLAFPLVLLLPSREQPAPKAHDCV